MTTNQGGETTHSEINVTPMIDVLLVLLIIFMVIVPALPRGEQAAVPKPAQHDRDTGESAIVLEILKGSQGEATYRINQHAVAREEQAGKLAEIYAPRAQRVLFVKADDQLSFTEIAQVIDIGHAAGVDRVGLITPGVASGL